MRFDLSFSLTAVFFAALKDVSVYFCAGFNDKFQEWPRVGEFYSRGAGVTGVQHLRVSSGLVLHTRPG